VEARVTDERIQFTIARSLVDQAAKQGRTISVTVEGPRRIRARLGPKPTTKEPTDGSQ
jgi:hypothetical protein